MDDAARRLGAYLTGAEARALADKLEAGIPMSTARASVGTARAPVIAGLIDELGLARPSLVALLRAIEGAQSTMRVVTPVWTAPDNLVEAGVLTSSVHHFIDRARESVVCATFNFQRSSALWDALMAASRRPEVKVRIYVDADAADSSPDRWSPTTSEVASELAPAAVFRSGRWHSRAVRSHAKFVAIDHQFLIVMSANFSASAERHNVELGFVIEDPIVTRAVEEQMAHLQEHLYERVEP